MKKTLILALILALVLNMAVINAGAVMTNNDPSKFSSVSVNGDASDEEAAALGAKLNDGYYYSYYENKRMFSDFKENSLDDLFVTFDEPGDYVQINFSSGNKNLITRLDVWVRGLNTIDEYEIEYKDSDMQWKHLCSGSLLKEYSASEIKEAKLGYCYPILLGKKPLPYAIGLRFIVKSYGESGKAEISEISVAQGKKSGNFLERSLLWQTINWNQKGAFDDGTNKKTKWTGTNNEASPFVHGFRCSGDTMDYSDSANSTYWAGAWPTKSYTTTIPNLIPDEDGNFYWTVDTLHVKQAPNHFVINVTSGAVKEYEILSSDSVDAFNDFTSGEWKMQAKAQGYFTGENEVSMYDVKDARYWMVKINDYEGDVEIAPFGVYVLNENAFSPVSRAAKAALDAVTQEIVVTEDINLNSQITLNDVSYDIDWVCESEYIDTETGTLTTPPEETKVILEAKVYPTESPDNAQIVEKELILGFEDTRIQTTLIEESFTEEKENMFISTEGNAVVTDGMLQLAADSAAEYDITFSEDFSYNGEGFIEIIPSGNDETGSIDLVASEESVLGIDFDGEYMTLRCKNGAKKYKEAIPKGIKLQLLGDVFNVLTDKDDGKGYEVRLYHAELFNEYENLDSVIFKTDSGEMEISELNYTVISRELLSQIEKQFTFDKISEYKPLAIRGNLDYISKVADIDFEYVSTDEDAVNPLTGEVDLSEQKYVVLTVTGRNRGGNFEIEFPIITGGENLFYNSEVSGSLALEESGGHSAAVDNDPSTEYVSEPKANWKLTLDLKSKKYFNKLIFFPADTEKSINTVVVAVSDNGRDFNDVYTGNGVVSGKAIDIPLQYSRYVSLTALQENSDTTGVAEIAGYLSLTDKERCEYDIAEALKSVDFEKGGSLNQVGTFGSEITVNSDNGAITAAKNGEKLDITVTEPETETHVNVTVTAKLGEAAVSQKQTVIFLGSGEIRDNVPVTDNSGNNNNGGNGNGDGGGGAFLPTVSAGTTDTSWESDSPVLRELEGHWGAEEIKELLIQGVVEGDGTSLNLKGTVTRAEFVKMLIAGFEFELEDYADDFADITADKWYKDYAKTAKSLGIMSGDGVAFRGDDPISRQEMAVALINTLKLKGFTQENSNEAGFKDYDNIALWAQEAVKAASATGLIKGYDTGEFMPDKNLLRDEAMVVIYRALDINTAAKGAAK